MLYRLLTENVNHEETLQLVATYFEGFTVVAATEYRQGKPKHSLIIEILPGEGVGDGVTRTVIDKLAYAIKKQTGQQAVIVQRIGCQNDMI